MYGKQYTLILSEVLIFYTACTDENCIQNQHPQQPIQSLLDIKMFFLCPARIKTLLVKAATIVPWLFQNSDWNVQKNCSEIFQQNRLALISGKWVHGYMVVKWPQDGDVTEKLHHRCFVVLALHRGYERGVLFWSLQPSWFPVFSSASVTFMLSGVMEWPDIEQCPCTADDVLVWCSFNVVPRDLAASPTWSSLYILHFRSHQTAVGLGSYPWRVIAVA